jgi:hypothetical protein
MFGPKHYVPILKWKFAEQHALRELKKDEKGWMTPFIQPVMPAPKIQRTGAKPKTQEEQLEELVSAFKIKSSKIAKEIVDNWGRSPIFLDLSLLYTSILRVETLPQILNQGEELAAFIIPVINLSSDPDFLTTASELSKKYKNGLCLRLVRADFIDSKNLAQQIENLLTTYKISPKEIDLMLDLNVTDEQDHEYYNLFSRGQTIPYLQTWRTFTLASGAFPTDLTQCEIGENSIPRSDWNKWLNSIQQKQLTRMPSFADYTIRHPIYKEAYQFFSPSASFVYTLNDSWLVMRGRKGKPEHYLANAQLLSQDKKFSSIFRGDIFSYGDRYITEKGKDLNTEKTGNATTWITAGINHHLANTVDQIANLP